MSGTATFFGCEPSTPSLQGAQPLRLGGHSKLAINRHLKTKLRSGDITGPRQLEERLAAGGAWKESGLVFTSPIGTPLDSRNVSREFHALLKAAALPSIRFHDLRHTAATLLLAHGVDPRTIMETLGARTRLVYFTAMVTLDLPRELVVALGVGGGDG